SEAMLRLLVEPIHKQGLWVPAQDAGATNIRTNTYTIYHWPEAHSIPLILPLSAYAFDTFIEKGKLQFDLAKAEQEMHE
ncbi:hydrogenase 3 membrane subunit, partial [Klebsiella variicola]|nr:hydrogenase 3 membrane subunit [Klebsiella variicola]